jgi:hypothetical protein
LSVIRIRRQIQAERFYCYQNPNSSGSLKDILSNDSSKSFKDLDIYQRLASFLNGRLKTTKSGLVNNIFICGDKNLGKSSVSNYLLNFFINNAESCDVNFVELDLGKPSFNIQCYVSGFFFKTPIFTNAPNSMIVHHRSEVIQEFFVGENNPHFNFESYLQKTAEILRLIKDKSLSQNRPCINIVNYHGYSKGFGKLLKQRVVDLLYGETFKIKLRTEGTITCTNRQKLAKQIVFSETLSSKSYKIHQPQFQQDLKQKLAFGYLTQNKNVVDLKLKNLRIKIVGPDRIQEFYNDYNLNFLSLTLMNSVVNVHLKISENDEINKLGLVISLDESSRTLQVNIPFLSKEDQESALLFEIVKTTYHDYNIQRYIKTSEPEELRDIPFAGIKMVGIGSKTLRRKISKRT